MYKYKVYDNFTTRFKLVLNLVWAFKLALPCGRKWFSAAFPFSISNCCGHINNFISTECEHFTIIMYTHKFIFIYACTDPHVFFYSQTAIENIMDRCNYLIIIYTYLRIHPPYAHWKRIPIQFIIIDFKIKFRQMTRIVM